MPPHRRSETAPSPSVVILMNSPVVPRSAIKRLSSPLSAFQPCPTMGGATLRQTWPLTGANDPLIGLYRPESQAIGPEHEWSTAICDMFVLFAKFEDANQASGDSARITASEMLRVLPAWRLHWNEESEALEELCRQLRLQLSSLGRILLFITKQLPEDCSAHDAMTSLHCALFNIDNSEFMPERFLASPTMCSWTRQWLPHTLLNIIPREQMPTQMTQPQDCISGHHPSRNIWLFDQYLTPTEHARISALKARIWNATRNPLLQLCASSQIERLLTRTDRLSLRTINALVPSAAAWFLHAYHEPSTPEIMLQGWYDVCVPSPVDENAGPKGLRYARLITQERKWWVFFKWKFLELQDREDVGLVTKQYAARALQRMNWLDGSGKEGFHQEMELRVEARKKSGRKP